MVGRMKCFFWGTPDSWTWKRTCDSPVQDLGKTWQAKMDELMVGKPWGGLGDGKGRHGDLRKCPLKFQTVKMGG